jgi:iron-sulfur cluster repair protein YtfE (RIC family)
MKKIQTFLPENINERFHQEMKEQDKSEYKLAQEIITSHYEEKTTLQKIKELLAKVP